MKLFNSPVTVRITALWAFSESFLGGILHAFRFPFAGLALSLIAALCMSLLAVKSDRKGVILKATLAVIAVKFILSPHTPPMAYLAVLIEGLAGELFFLQRRFIRATSFFLTLFCLLYSAFQRLLVLTILFGTGFWKALDDFLNRITSAFIKQPQQYSLFLVLFYIGCYLLAGILGGIMNGRIVKRLQSKNEPLPVIDFSDYNNEPVANQVAEKETGYKRKINPKYLLAASLLILLILSYTPLFPQSLLKSKFAEIAIRGLLIIFIWTLIISPILIRQISKWVNKYKMGNASGLQEVLLVLPDIKKIVQYSWQSAAGKNKLAKFSSFLSTTSLLIVYDR